MKGRKMEILATVMGETRRISEDDVRATNVPTLVAFLNDDYVSSVTIQSLAHGMMPVTYQKVKPLT